MPTTVGVPLATPAAESVTPAGKVPAVTDQLYGAMPPLGASVVEKGVLTMAFGRFCVPTLRVVAFTVSENCWLTLCAEASVTFTVKLDVPMAVGVPLRTPAEESAMPAGRVPAETENVKGAVPPDAAMAAL